MSAFAPLKRKSDSTDITPTRKTGGHPHHALQRLPAAQSSGGVPLSPKVREVLEPRFGASFKHVKVHHDQAADALSRGLNARTFTVGSDVYFRQGQFEPGTERGQRLLAHELVLPLDYFQSTAVLGSDLELDHQSPATRTAEEQ